MIGISALASAFRPMGKAAPVVAQPVRALLPFNRSWERVMENIEAQIADAQERRVALVAELGPLTLASVEGDSEARKKVDAIERQVEDVDRELSRLSVARRRASERLAAERAAASEKEHRQRVREAHAAAVTVRQCAADVDKAVAALAAVLDTYLEATAQLGAAIGREGEGSSVLRRLQQLVPTVVIAELRAVTGLAFPPGAPNLDGDPLYWRRLAADRHMPDPDYCASIVEKQWTKAKEVAA